MADNKNVITSSDNHDQGNLDYDQLTYNLVSKIISQNGAKILLDKSAFLQAASIELLDNEKLKSFLQYSLEDNALNRLLSIAKESPDTQYSAISDLTCTLYVSSWAWPYTYQFEEDHIRQIIVAFVKALNEANISLKGKDTCSQLKELRRLFALTNNIEYTEDDCTYNGPCEGTCPYCELKTKELLEKAGSLDSIKYPKHEITTTETNDTDKTDFNSLTGVLDNIWFYGE